jgi:galactose mutarotase-like enzyme
VDLRVELGWCTDTLPQFVEWKMPGQGAHVLGIEPANCFVEGRDVERRRGTLVMLEPGESRHYALELRVDRP